MSLESFGYFLRETRLIGRATAAGVVLYGLHLVGYYMTNSNIQPETLAVGASIVTGAATFLFMSEAK